MTPEITIQTADISMGWGHISSQYSSEPPLPFLTREQVKEMESINYSGKLTNGKKCDHYTYLNSLGLGTFEMIRTGGHRDESEYYTVVRAYHK